MVWFHGRIFCALFNLKSLLRGWDIRFKYSPEDKLYYATNGKLKSYFSQRKIANYNYSKGFAKRANEIGRAYFLDLVDFKDGDFVVDCGANVGDLMLYFVHKNINIEYLGFEPSPSEFLCLKRNVSPQRAINAGLWFEEGELKFYVSSQGADSSFIEPLRYEAIETVPAHRLDELLLGRHIKLLKLEAEGAEPEVIAGCAGILNDIDYVAADLGPERGKEQESTLVPVINFMLKSNFEIVDINTSREVVLFKNKSNSSA
jgi:FkbM family methyltransferase